MQPPRLLAPFRDARLTICAALHVYQSLNLTIETFVPYVLRLHRCGVLPPLTGSVCASPIPCRWLLARGRVKASRLQRKVNHAASIRALRSKIAHAGHTVAAAAHATSAAGHRAGHAALVAGHRATSYVRHRASSAVSSASSGPHTEGAGVSARGGASVGAGVGAGAGAGAGEHGAVGSVKSRASEDDGFAGVAPNPDALVASSAAHHLLHILPEDDADRAAMAPASAAPSIHPHEGARRPVSSIHTAVAESYEISFNKLDSDNTYGLHTPESLVEAVREKWRAVAGEDAPIHAAETSMDCNHYTVDDIVIEVGLHAALRMGVRLVAHAVACHSPRRASSIHVRTIWTC